MPYTDKNWTDFFGTVGRPDPAADPWFSSSGARHENNAALQAELTDLIAQRTVRARLEDCRDLGFAAQSVQDLDEIEQNPYYAARHALIDARHPIEDDYTLIRFPVDFSATPVTTTGPRPVSDPASPPCAGSTRAPRPPLPLKRKENLVSTTTVDVQRRQAIEQHYGPLGPHAVELTDGVIVTADDGFGLNGTLAFPAGLGKVPAVLMRTPYNPASFPPEVAAFYLGEVIAWASHGYACFLQTTRTSTSYFDEAADGSATVRWLERQPWFDGRLGLNGASYHAFTSWATAATRPACLKAISTAMYSTDRVSSWYPGGGFGLELALSWTAIQQADGATVGESLYDHLPLNQADVAATGTTLDFYQERLAYDGEDPHWQPLNFAELLDDPPAPVLHIDGWYDYHRVPFWHDFERLSRNNSHVPYRLVIGPWPHAAPDPRIAMTEKLAWFDTYVRGDGTGRFGALRYYRTGADADWHELEKWRKPETTVFHASSDEQLLAARSDVAERVEWTYDPADPTPSVGFSALGAVDVSGLWDSGPLEQRADVRAFTSAPLREPLDLAGPVSATTTFASDAPSADLFLRVLDVHENGQVQTVVDGIIRVTDPGLRDGVPVEVDLGPIGHRFAAGHRLRLLVASGAHPYYNRNLGNAEPTATAAQLRVAHQAVAVGGEDGLRIALPLARGGV